MSRPEPIHGALTTPDLTTGRPPSEGGRLPVEKAAAMDVSDVLTLLASSRTGLSSADADERKQRFGPNAVPRQTTALIDVLVRQVRSPLLILLFATAVLSAGLGESSNAVIIVGILLASVSLGTVNDYRATRTAQALAGQVRRRIETSRDGHGTDVEVTDLVPGDIVRLSPGVIVPADIRLVQVDALSCDESVLTGESFPVDKRTEAVAAGSALSELRSCALMGTVVQGGGGRGVVVATGGGTEFGRLARSLQTTAPQTSFQAGLRQFSVLLVIIAAAVSSTVFIVNILLGRSVIDALLFSTAIAVGITPQLLPAVVATSLADGSHRLARRRVLVKRLDAIEDLGDMDVLVTDKTGTLTTGVFTLEASITSDGSPSDEPARAALLGTSIQPAADGTLRGDPLDVALWEGVQEARSVVAGVTELGRLPFDHVRRIAGTLVQRAPGRTAELVVTGAPEAVLALCTGVTDSERALVAAQLADGGRVIAVAVRDAADVRHLTVGDACDMSFSGLVVFDDPAKPDANGALERLAALDVRVVIATGDSAGAAQRLARTLHLGDGSMLTGSDVDALSDSELTSQLATTSVLARVSPDQKARVVRSLSAGGHSVGFLGDGVNDAVGLHQADVGLSVDTAADVAREAADIVLLEKSLDVVATGIGEGRRIFANTVKYVLMGTSSNFGNIISAGAASTLLPFLPLLPSQLLLNNLLYDSGQLTIPTDNVDESQLTRPGQWDVRLIRRFLLVFGPLSSLFDFITFGLLLGTFHAGPQLFRSGWFVESLATQTAVVFAIRTRRFPLFRSRPSRPLLASAATVITVGALLPLSPLGHALGFAPPRAAMYAAIAVLVVTYVALVDATKTAVLTRLDPTTAPDAQRRLLRRRLSRFPPQP